MGENARLTTVDALRGLAALLVCLFHFTNGRSEFAPAFWFGVRGIEVFFVISGFVLPFALARAGYTLTAWPRFLVKRVVRIDPPYLASIAIALAIAFAVRAAGGNAPPATAPQVASHVAFMTGMLGFEWLNVVYWTLALELQFYLLLAVLFPLIEKPTLGTAIAVSAACVLFAVAVGPSRVWVASYLPVFAAGFLAYWLRCGVLRPLPFLALLATESVGAAWLQADVSVGIAAAATALAIAFVTVPTWRIVLFFGAISYPLYLLHVPIGVRVLNAAGKLGTFEAVGIAAALGASVLAAYVLHVAVEVPAMRLATRIGYGKKHLGPLPVPARAEPTIAEP